MPCLMGLVALAFPRLAVALVWFFNTGYFSRAFGSSLLPLIGFVFLPLTTLTFAYAHNALANGGPVTTLGWILTLIALLIDFGLMGGGHRHYRRYRTR